MPAANDEILLSQQVTSTLNRVKDLAFLTDATVAAADTKAGLKTAINAVPVHNDMVNIKLALIRALDLNPNITDANILNLTTVDGLIALTGTPTASRMVIE